MNIEFIVENLLVSVGGILWVAASFSQLWKIYKTKNTKGLSIVNQVLSASGDLAWSVYFISQNNIAPAVLCLVLTVITTFIVACLLSDRKLFKKGLITIYIIGLATSVVYILLPDLSGWLGVVYSMLAFSPWLIHMIKNRDLTGVSEKSILFGYLAIVGTLIYGVLINSVQVMASGIIGILTQTIVLVFFLKSVNKKSFGLLDRLVKSLRRV